MSSNRIQLACLAEAERTSVIMGPTASGKSSLALLLAERFNGEIVSADSMQFYRGLEIGVAKPTAAEQARVRHHLLDTMNISEKSDIFRFQKEAENAVADIRARGKLPVVAGGSGLYLHALLYGLDPMPADAVLREELNKKFDHDEGFPELTAIMAEKCPDDLTRFGADRRKLLRAYEVYLLSGSQMTDLQKKRHNQKARPDMQSFVLIWEREELKKRILARTEEMLRTGWIGEARTLLAQGLMETPTAWQALGYSHIARYLAGGLSRADLPQAIATSTWQFARRQITWFTHQHPEAIPIHMPCEFF